VGVNVAVPGVVIVVVVVISSSESGSSIRFSSVSSPIDRF
jgi:hypothetical protein